MKYLKSYQPFLESNQESDFIDLISNIESIAKQNGLDINRDEEEIAKHLLDEIEKNKKISSEINKVEQIIKESINESAHASGLTELFHIIEPYYEMGENIETSHDVTPHYLHKETTSLIKKYWHKIVEVIHWFSKGVGYLFNLFEKAIYLLASKVFGYTTSYKIGKFSFAAIALAIIISIVISIKSFIISPLGFISLLLASLKGKVLLFAKIKSTCQSVWSFIKSLIKAEHAEAGELITPVEFFDSLPDSIINKISTNEYLATDIKDIQDLFLDFDDEGKKIISDKLLSLFNKETQELDKIKMSEVPYLRGIFLPILPKTENHLLKTIIYEKETKDDFKHWVNQQKIKSYNDYVDISSDDIEQRFGDKLSRIKEWSDKVADDLQKAMDGPGTDEQKIFDLFEEISKPDQLTAEVKFFSVYLSFGIRSNSDLIEWLLDDLNKEELKKLVEILDKDKRNHPWKKGWDVSNILTSGLKNYQTNNPHWSMSLSGRNH